MSDCGRTKLAERAEGLQAACAAVPTLQDVHESVRLRPMRSRGPASRAKRVILMLTFRAQGRTAEPSFDHLVGAGEQRRRHVETERLRGGQIDYKIEFGRLFDGDVCGLHPTQNLVD
jgi:hypothetical protein